MSSCIFVHLLRSKLGQSEAAIAHVKGREALDEFSKKELSKYGDHYSPLKEHAPKKFERMTVRLADKNPKAKDRRGHCLTIAGSVFFGMWMSVSLVAEWKQLTNLALY
ncbi:MAG: hypothetical protein ACKVKH_04220 [Verrucomicrobiales bacterium]